MIAPLAAVVPAAGLGTRLLPLTLGVAKELLPLGAQPALAATLPDWRPTHPHGGTSLWVRLPGPFATDLALLAPGAGVP